MKDNSKGAGKKKRRGASFKIVEDEVFADVLEVEKPRFVVDYDRYLQRLWDANPELHRILKASPSLEEARRGVYAYLEQAERGVFDVENELHILEKATVREVKNALPGRKSLAYTTVLSVMQVLEKKGFLRH